jgi:hypothetical protein
MTSVNAELFHREQHDEPEPKYSFDSACYDLAEHFYPNAPTELLNELAQRFQDQAEGSSSAELDAWQEADTQRRCSPGSR